MKSNSWRLSTREILDVIWHSFCVMRIIEVVSEFPRWCFDLLDPPLSHSFHWQRMYLHVNKHASHVSIVRHTKLHAQHALCKWSAALEKRCFGYSAVLFIVHTFATYVIRSLYCIEPLMCLLCFHLFSNRAVVAQVYSLHTETKP